MTYLSLLTYGFLKVSKTRILSADFSTRFADPPELWDRVTRAKPIRFVKRVSLSIAMALATCATYSACKSYGRTYVRNDFVADSIDLMILY